MTKSIKVGLSVMVICALIGGLISYGNYQKISQDFFELAITLWLFLLMIVGIFRFVIYKLT